MSERAGAEADRQLPLPGEIFLDHVGHFVRDADAARRALARAGFTPTPLSVHVDPAPAAGAPRPTGTGNVTAMLARGYIEVLFKTADTALGRELEAGLARYRGVHLAAFAVADAAAAHRRLGDAGLSPAAAGGDAAPGRYRRRIRDRRIHGGATGGRRDAGGPRPDPHPPDGAHGLAAALARRMPTARAACAA